MGSLSINRLLKAEETAGMDGSTGTNWKPH